MRELRTAFIAVIAFTVVLGLAYPLVMTGVSQVVFPERADGSMVKRDGKVVGSRLIGQDFSKQPRVLPEPAVGDGLRARRRPSSTTRARTSGTSPTSSRATSTPT